MRSGFRHTWGASLTNRNLNDTSPPQVVAYRPKGAIVIATETSPTSGLNLYAPRYPLFDRRHLHHFRRGHAPGQLIIQYTDRCNASCAQCGMRKENEFERATASLDDVKRLLDSAISRGIEAVSFTGGEPFMYMNDIFEGVRYAKSLGFRYLRTGTNGFMFMGHHRPSFRDKMHRLGDQLANSGLHNFWISIDSADIGVHERNRGLPGVIDGIAKALPILHEHGFYPSANLGINRYLGSADAPPTSTSGFDADAFYGHFRESFRHFYRFVNDLGFTIVNACYPMSFDDAATHSVYTATSEDNFVNFREDEKLQLFRAMFDTIPEFRHQLRVFTPLCSLHALIRNYAGEPDAGYACRGGIDFFFVDAKDMQTYPCGFRGDESMGKFWDLDTDQIDHTPWCRQCDWECFRDPSEMMGPILDLFNHPTRIAKQFWDDRAYAKIWYQDVRYYQACNFFNAQLPPDYKKLAHFAMAPRS